MSAPSLTELHFKPYLHRSPLPLSPTPLICTKPHRYPPPKRHSCTSFSLSASSSSSSSSSNTTFFLYSQRQFPHHHNPKPEEEFVKHEFEEEHVIGDCLVFEEGAFEVDNPFLPPDPCNGEKKPRGKKQVGEVEAENLVPEKWKEAVAQINLTKKEKRKIAQELKFGSRLERRKKLPVTDMEEYLEYRSMKLSHLKPVVLDDPSKLPPPTLEDRGEIVGPLSGRAAPRNPRLQVSEGSLDAITDFFNSGHYVPSDDNDDKKPQGRRKLFTQEEKVLLNKRIPTLGEATTSKWLPLHTLSASGEFYLLDVLLKHNVDINATDKHGLCAIHKAIIGKKQAIINYLMRESANPFVRDNDGATLMHYAVQTAASQAIKILLLYNVDINLSDNDGWTPLHLAVQTKRTDIVRLLLIKGADKSLKNRDGLTPLDLCLYSGQNMSTYELIRLLKQLPRSKYEDKV